MLSLWILQYGTISKSYNIKNDKLIGFYMKNERKNNNILAKAITKAIKPDKPLAIK